MEKHGFDNMILGTNCVQSTNSAQTGRNNNVLVIGGSGSGKTRSVVEPTLLECSNASLVVSDPKGRLISTYGDYFYRKGYRVETLDFIHPENNRVAYDPLRMLYADAPGKKDSFRNAVRENDIYGLARMLLRADQNHINVGGDPFWYDMAEILLSAVMALHIETASREKCNMSSVIRMLEDYEFRGDTMGAYCNVEADKAFGRLENAEMAQKRGGAGKGSYALRQYRKILSMPPKTLACVYAVLESVLGSLSSSEIQHLMCEKKHLSPARMLKEKTVLFIQTSDTDSDLDSFVNIFYTQLMQKIIRLKDEPAYANSIPVRFILDDFATTVVIPDMPRWSSMIRARDISVMLILQSVTQLEKMYGQADARTIIANCDNMVYLRSNDLRTAEEFSIRLGKPLQEVMYLPIGAEHIFLSGEKPVTTTRYDITQHPAYEEERPEKLPVLQAV